MSKYFGHVIGVKNASNFGNPVRFAREKRRDYRVSTNYFNVQRLMSNVQCLMFQHLENIRRLLLNLLQLILHVHHETLNL